MALLSRVPLCTTLSSDHGARAKNPQIQLLHFKVEVLNTGLASVLRVAAVLLGILVNVMLECLYAPTVSHQPGSDVDVLAH